MYGLAQYQIMQILAVHGLTKQNLCTRNHSLQQPSFCGIESSGKITVQYQPNTDIKSH